MKTSIFTLALAITLVSGITRSGFAATSSKDEITTLAQTTPIHKIEVHGNVELYLSNGGADQVKVYNRYYSENALVQNQNGVLSISSYKAEKLVVWVTAADLGNLSLYDDAEVNS